MSTISAQDLESYGPRMVPQAVWFFLHAVFAMRVLAAFMGAVTLLLQTQSIT